MKNITFNYIILNYKIIKDYLNKNNHEKQKNIFEKSSDINEKINDYSDKCYYSPDNTDIKIIHFILTRFIIEFGKGDRFIKNIYKEEYILNGIRVMKQYLIPSLENQSCKKFIWIITLGDNANINYIKSLINFKPSFDFDIIYISDLQKYLRNKTKGFDVLISTRMDYDDRIYYDAVNDLRKLVNIGKPLQIYGYNRGVTYFEEDNKYYYFWVNYKEGAWSVFESLITVLNKVNNIYTVNDLGAHNVIRKNLFKLYKSFGVKVLNYEPAIFDSGEAKFVYVRQKYSRDYRLYTNKRKRGIECNFNLSKFYGK